MASLPYMYHSSKFNIASPLDIVLPANSLTTNAKWLYFPLVVIDSLNSFDAYVGLAPFL